MLLSKIHFLIFFFKFSYKNLKSNKKFKIFSLNSSLKILKFKDQCKKFKINENFTKQNQGQKSKSENNFSHLFHFTSQKEIFHNLRNFKKLMKF